MGAGRLGERITPVKIIGLQVYEYGVNYAHGEYVMSGGRAATEQRGLLVRIRTDEGIDGWGESTQLGSTYLPTSAAATRSALEELLPHLVGVDPTNTLALNELMDGILLGGTSAKSAIDIACWDVRGRALGVPVSALLGGVLQPSFPLYEAVPLGRPEEMAAFVETQRATGVNIFQLKVGNRPEDDIERVHAAVAAGDRDTVVIADANGGWNLLEAESVLKRIDDLDLYIEQPCRTTRDSASAHRHSRLPLVLDESITTAAELIEARTLASATAVNLKIGRIGGITKAVRLRDLAQDLNMMVTIEDTWGGDVTTAAVSHVAATTRPKSLLSASFFNDWTDGHVAGHQPRSADGRGSAPDGPGLGITVQPEALGEPVIMVGAAA